MPDTELQTSQVPLSDLRAYPGNPRRGDVEAIKTSLRAHGQYRPIVVNRPTMQVLAGNHTLEAAPSWAGSTSRPPPWTSATSRPSASCWSTTARMI
jgi:ParB/Sulfiredoxin domain